MMAPWVMVALILSCATASLQSAVNVSVYYESLCPDSIAFITRQLYPTWVALTSSYLAVDFVPYGKASQQQSEDGGWTFSCQHGPGECVGNKVQACALNIITNNSQQVEFVHCAMSDTYPPSSGQRCANSLNASFTQLEECYNGRQGGQLLAALGNRTHNFQPTITFVPTVAFNGVYNDEDESESLRNFLSVVCRHITGEKPSACS